MCFKFRFHSVGKGTLSHHGSRTTATTARYENCHSCGGIDPGTVNLWN